VELRGRLKCKKVKVTSDLQCFEMCISTNGPSGLNLRLSIAILSQKPLAAGSNDGGLLEGFHGPYVREKEQQIQLQ